MLQIHELGDEIARGGVVNRVVYGGERVVVTRHGKPLVALVSAADLQRLEGEEAAAEEQVISSVSSIGSAPSAQGERRRFGIAAEHRPHDGNGRGNGDDGGRNA
ncbi:type II toxin-antitoxin system prevent-host-death family antitoxin [Streptomyces sp. NPDC006863]|uniref:type II toxin-antitoxin system prevent-host-death family antitoxin n=1 Tax=Streptomyces sp. NPDC006863 TaxID=3154779 RepID=UPI0033D90D59